MIILDDVAVQLAVASPALPSGRSPTCADYQTFQPPLWNSTSDSRRLLHPSALLSDQPSTCVADQPSSLAFGTQLPALTVCCIIRFCLPADLRLATTANLPALPLNSTSGSHRLLHLRLCLPINLRLASPVNLSACLRIRPPTLIGSLRPPAPSSNQPSTCVSSRPSDFALEPNPRLIIGSPHSPVLPSESASGLRPLPNLPALPQNSTSNLHRLSHPPASPSDRPSTCVSDLPSSSTSDSTSGFHRWISSGRAVNQLPTCVGY